MLGFRSLGPFLIPDHLSEPEVDRRCTSELSVFSLGAFHDGDERIPQAAPCTGSDQHVMAAILGATNERTFYNPFSFSHCSVTQFRNVFDMLTL